MTAALAVALAALQAAAAPAAAPPPPPACSTPEYRALDFWVGDWEGTFDLGNGKTGHATNRITRDEFGSCVIAEHFDAPPGGNGASFSTYDRLKKKWVQTWVDNSGGYLTLIGGPVEGQPWRFRLDTVDPRGPKPAYYRMIWQDVTADSFTWRWQQREADGSYSDSWVIRYTRRK